MPKKEKGHHQQGGVNLSNTVNLMSSITYEAENVSQPVTCFSLAAKSSQQIVTKAVQYLQNILTLHVDKVYTTFWTHLAQRDRSTADVPARSPYDIGYDHAAAHLPSGMVSEQVEREQDAYYFALPVGQQWDYERGWLHGYTSAPRQPEREVAA